MTVVKIALLGAGTVGTQIARLLSKQKEDLAAGSGAQLELVGITVRDIPAPRDPAVDGSLLADDPESIIGETNVVIELMGGIEPARAYILRAFAAGISVTTGNKALLAAHNPELYRAAAQADVDLCYEATVAGAVPVVYGLCEPLAGGRITAVLGIVDGTTNYILDEATVKGFDFDEAFAKTQELGYAEVDPTADIDGLDTAAECAILAPLAFHTRVSIDDVHVHGIRSITKADIKSAGRSGCVVKLVTSAKRRPKGIELHIGPTLVPLDHPLASIRGAFDAVVIEAEAADRLIFCGLGAGGAPTTSAVLSDVATTASHRVDGGRASRELIYRDIPVLETSHGRSNFRVEFVVHDEIGMLTKVTEAFVAYDVSIKAVVQTIGEDGLARLTVNTHEALRADLEVTSAKLTDAEFISEVHNVNRVEKS